MKISVKNIAALCAVMVMAAGCSNEELNQLSEQNNLPLELTATVGSLQSRAAQTVTFGDLSNGISFNLSLGEDSKNMSLGTDGVITYSDGGAEKFKVNPAKAYTPTASIENVPMKMTREGVDFALKLNLKSAEGKTIQPEVIRDTEEKLVAKAILPLEVATNGLCIEFTSTQEPVSITTKVNGTEETITLSTEQLPTNFKKAGENKYIYVTTLTQEVSAGEIAYVTIANDNGYAITTTAGIPADGASLYVVSAEHPEIASTLCAVSRSAKGVLPVSIPW